MTANRLLKLAHFVGLIIFLGSIFTFIVISTLTKNASLENLAFGRSIISTGTLVLTLPGMWVLAVSGIFMGIRRYGVKNRFVQIKFILITAIILNAYFFVVPAAQMASAIANRSLIIGHLLPGYADAYQRETLFGAINVLLTMTAAVVGVWKIGATDRSRQ